MNNNTKKIKQKFEKKESSKIGIELDINNSFPNSLKNNIDIIFYIFLVKFYT